MERDWKTSVVKISSAELKNPSFGTGFVIHHDEQATYLLTCAHVIKDVGIDQVKIDGKQAFVVASGAEKGLDLAVLQTEILERPPLNFCVSSIKGLPISVVGFQLLSLLCGDEYLLRPLHGHLGEQIGIETKRQTKRTIAWDLKIEDDFYLQPGYSGAPVIDKESECVLGIAVFRLASGEKGIAISVEAIREIWAEMPSDLLTHIPFTNRESEIKELFYNPYAPTYHYLDAPAGYGKTELLKELEQRYKDDREYEWDCVYLAVYEGDSVVDVINALAEKLDLDLKQNLDWPLPERLGVALSNQWSSQAYQKKRGLVLLIDLEKKPDLSVAKELLEEFIPIIYESLRELKSFEKADQLFRVILAGRYLSTSSEIKSSPLTFNRFRLSTFDYDVIQSSAKKYLKGRAASSIDQISAHLLFLTGGRPGCIAQIMEDYKKSPGLTPDKFLKLHNKSINQIVRNVVDSIYNEIPENIREIFDTIHSLSIFRYLDSGILKNAIESHPHLSNTVGTEYDLAQALTSTYLFTRNKRFLQDNIIQRLLAIRLRYNSPEEFSTLCLQAREICKSRISRRVQIPEKWVIEYLFQSLQQYANSLQIKRERNKLRRTFFDKDLPEILQIFIEGQDISTEDMMVEQEVLQQTMDDDWEFQFVVNYYLCEEEYSEQPYKELFKQINDYFSQRLA